MQQMMYVDDVSIGFLGVSPWQVNSGKNYGQFLDRYSSKCFFGCQQQMSANAFVITNILVENSNFSI